MKLLNYKEAEDWADTGVEIGAFSKYIVSGGSKKDTSIEIFAGPKLLDGNISYENGIWTVDGKYIV